MSNTNQIRAGALLSYVAIAFNIIAGLIYTPWMVRVIGKSDYAIYVLANSFLTYFVIDFGLWLAIAKILSKYKSEGKEEEAKNLLGLSARLYLIIDLIIFISIIVVYFFIDRIFLKLTPNEIERFKIVYLIAGFFSVVSFPFSSLKGVFVSYSFFGPSRAFDLISKIAIILVMIIALKLGFGLYSLVVVTGTIGLIATIGRLIYLRKKTTLKINLSYYNKSLTKDLFRTSIWIFLIIVSELLLRNSAPTVLGIFSGSEQIAIFAIALLIDGYNTTLANAINGFFLPKVTELQINCVNLNMLDELMIKVGRIQLLVSGFVLIGFITLGKEFINLWMGADFKGSYYVTLFLICPGIVLLTQEIAGTQLLVSDKLKYKSYLYFIGGIAGIIVTILLAPKFGALGAGIGIFTGSVFFFLLGMNFVYWKKLKLNIPRFFKECHLSLLIPILLSLAIGLLIQYFLPSGNWIQFSFKALLIGSFYIIIMWMIGMNSYEKQLLSSVVHKITSSRKQKH